MPKNGRFMTDSPALMTMSGRATIMVSMGFWYWRRPIFLPNKSSTRPMSADRRILVVAAKTYSLLDVLL